MHGINVKFMALCTYVVVNIYITPIVIYLKIILLNPVFFLQKSVRNNVINSWFLIFPNIINN